MMAFLKTQLLQAVRSSACSGAGVRGGKNTDLGQPEGKRAGQEPLNMVFPETHWCFIIQHRENNLLALPSPSGVVVAILFLLLLW